MCRPYIKTISESDHSSVEVNERGNPLHLQVCGPRSTTPVEELG